MSLRNIFKIGSIILVLTAVVCVSASGGESKRSATVVKADGHVTVKPAAGRAWQKAVAGMALGEGDAIKTGPESIAVIDIEGSSRASTVEITQNASLVLSQLVKGPKPDTYKTLLDLSSGEVTIEADKLNSPESKFEVKTPTSVIGVRGTKFSVKVETLE